MALARCALVDWGFGNIEKGERDGRFDSIHASPRPLACCVLQCALLIAHSEPSPTHASWSSKPDGYAKRALQISPDASGVHVFINSDKREPTHTGQIHKPQTITIIMRLSASIAGCLLLVASAAIVVQVRVLCVTSICSKIRCNNAGRGVCVTRRFTWARHDQSLDRPLDRSTKRPRRIPI